MRRICVGEHDEVFVIGGVAYHNSIPTTMFNYCLMKSIMTDIGTTSEELDIFEGQFYGTRELTCVKD